MIVDMLDNMVGGSMGQAAPRYYNYIGTIFVFILVSNISGLLGLRPPTADYGVTLPLAVLTFCAIMAVTDNTLANRRNDREIGTAMALITLMGSQIGSQGGRGEQRSVQIVIGFWYFHLL